MKRLKLISAVIGVIVAILTAVWVSMQIYGWLNESDPSLRPPPGKFCYIFFDDKQPLPAKYVVTNTIGGEAVIDEFSRFAPLDAWTVGTELNVWSFPDATGKREPIGTAVLLARNGEWVRIDLPRLKPPPLVPGKNTQQSP